MAPPKRLRTNKKLLTLRIRLQLTQTEMGKKLGISLRTYQEYEAGGPIMKPVKIIIAAIESGKL